MKIGDYVRTKYGIAKVISTKVKDEDDNNVLQVDKMLEPYFCDGCDRFLCDPKDVIKSNTNIMDLILPKDLMYIDISPDNCGGIVVPRIPETYCELNQIINEIKLGNYILKGVVIKEQLMENMYKVESEVN